MNSVPGAPKDDIVFYHYIYDEAKDRFDKFYLNVNTQRKEIKLVKIKPDRDLKDIQEK